MIVYQRPIKFWEVDAARIVFFGNYSIFSEEAIEHFFASGIEGGNVELIEQRGIGFPCVRLEANFIAPSRYGDVLRIETSCEHLGTKSARMLHRMSRSGDGQLCAEVRHTVAAVRVSDFQSIAIPADLRDLFSAHRHGATLAT